MGRRALLRIFLDLDHTLLSSRQGVPIDALPPHILHLPAVAIRRRTHVSSTTRSFTSSASSVSSRGLLLRPPAALQVAREVSPLVSSLSSTPDLGKQQNEPDVARTRSITVRPYAAQFLQALAALPHTRLAVFTANTAEYAESIVEDVINAKLLLAHQHIDLSTDVFSREHCREIVLDDDVAQGHSDVADSGDVTTDTLAFRYLQKDLDALPGGAIGTFAAYDASAVEDHLEWPLLLDDTIRSFVPYQFWRGSGVLVEPFHAKRRWSVDDEISADLMDVVLPVIESVHRALVCHWATGSTHDVRGMGDHAATYQNVDDTRQGMRRAEKVKRAIGDILDAYHAPAADKIAAVFGCEGS